MKDTLVCRSIEEARRVAFGKTRRRVVTLDGNVINPSGEMRGFSKPVQGKMLILEEARTSFTPEDLK